MSFDRRVVAEQPLAAQSFLSEVEREVALELAETSAAADVKVRRGVTHEERVLSVLSSERNAWHVDETVEGMRAEEAAEEEEDAAAAEADEAVADATTDEDALED